MNARRIRIHVEGAVQGVGFRPFVYRQAVALGLCGWVRNCGSSVEIEAQGLSTAALVDRIQASHPPHASVACLQVEEIAAIDEQAFRILPSRPGEDVITVVPDLATCQDCRREILDPTSRFYRYPFTNCSQCGPRYSIVERVPYDRANTTMRGFAMCSECRREYGDPLNRRYHAQPTACSKCGPGLSLHGNATSADPLQLATKSLHDGQIVAIKGLGGFQLLVDASLSERVERLRQRKRRPHKPLAVMVRDIGEAREYCMVDAAEAHLLESAGAPIVLLTRRPGRLPDALAPDTGTLGVMLPATPLHLLLAQEFAGPLVCTSGNLSSEPICTDNEEAVERLGRIADVFLLHDRPIRRALDDSVARVIDGEPQLLRLARGFAPLPFPVRKGRQALAAGSHLKNTLSLCDSGRIIVGQHNGDLENSLSVDAMRQAGADLREFFGVRPAVVACDLHPDYASSVYARELKLPTVAVQHHVSHALACMLEHGLSEVLAVVWDGSGLGPDGTIWGGEFLQVDRTPSGVTWRRVAHLKQFRLPGGDAASKETSRCLAGAMWEVPELKGLVSSSARQLLERGLNSPVCSSAGRLFDAMAALTGLCAVQTYEGQGASRLEAAAGTQQSVDYQLSLAGGVLDWRDLLLAAHGDATSGVAAGEIAARFHAGLASGILSVALDSARKSVVLTGGCFQNRLLTELAVRRLREAGFEPVLARRIPPNDGGVSPGQLVATVEGVSNVSGHTG
ncbi:MAG: carbamoyltransferase HypF [Planctomycetes bacterium]|nr:carbamoyltransferase HypF [Planctomycetota bacterium]